MKKFHFNSEEKFLIKIVALVLAGLLFVAYGHFVENRVIESAQLIEVTDDGYEIAYGDEVHSYTFAD